MYIVYNSAEAAPSVIQMNGVKLSLPTARESRLWKRADVRKGIKHDDQHGTIFHAMTFVASAGGRIETGHQLVRDIKVEVKNEE